MSDTQSRRRKAEQIQYLLDTERDAIRENTTHFNQERYGAIENFDRYEEMRDRARAIKEDAIEHLPELIEQVEESVAANGGQVYVAEDAVEARELVADLADGGTVVKSKSMTTEEIELNEHLIEAGADVWETDLGEFVLQVADESPSHIVGPSLHKSKDEIADLFNQHFDPDEPLETAEELTSFARDFLGEKIRAADMGITGANFVVADSGTIMLVTNEGNARKSAVTPDTHVAVAGVEKLIPSVSDLEPFIELISKAATGQDVPQYLTLLSPPVDTPTLDFDAGTNVSGDDDDREFHLVLIDNGRFAMRDDDQLRETLYCIRCGACSNSCANFQHVGGHAFGGETYSGGIATGWEAGIEGLDTAAEFNDFCTGCSRCVHNCPVKIDIPWINTVVRDRINHGGSEEQLDWLVEGLTPDAEPGGLDMRKRFFGNFETVGRIASATAPVSNWVAGSTPARTLMENVLGIDSRRPLPTFERETLRDWFDARGGTHASDRATREVVLYPDAYTNYVHTERGKAAVRTLEALGVAVRVPNISASGRAPLSQGMVATAAEQAEAVATSLESHIDRGRDVVVIEPSDVAMFEREYERFLPSALYEHIRDGSYELIEYVYGLLANGADPDALSKGDGETIGYHGHCQQRTLGLDVYTEAVFDELGYDVVSSNVECCGMAGSFGYKQEYYDLSIDVGNDLKNEFDNFDGPVTASGTSCIEQLGGLLREPVRHPVEILDPNAAPRRN